MLSADINYICWFVKVHLVVLVDNVHCIIAYTLDESRHPSLEEDCQPPTQCQPAVFPPKGRTRSMLRTPVNQCCWRTQLEAKCQLCTSIRPTTSHILNWCHVSLNQGRYTRRHDSFLAQLVKGIQSTLPMVIKFNADHGGWETERNSPANIPSQCHVFISAF